MVQLSNVRKVSVGNSKVKVGYSEQLNKYILCVKVTDWVIDYDRWYSITESEFNDDKLIKEIYKSECKDNKSDRFIFSWRKAENTEEQGKLLHSIVGEDIE